QASGWADSRNVRIETRWSAGDPEHARAYAAELVALAPDVILDDGGTQRRPSPRRACDPAQTTRKLSQGYHSSPADVRSPIGAGDPERAPVPRDRGQEPSAPIGKREQVAVRL